jgi:dTMP kinase
LAEEVKAGGRYTITVTMITSNGGASTPKRGAFILLEGVDRCGKTTQVSLLVKHLVSLSIATVAYRFPDRSTQGECS